MELKKQVIEHINYLEQINGYITPDMLIADAKDPVSPLHNQFNWDVNEAAKAHWIETARKIIRSVKVIVTVDKKTIRTVAYVRDPSLSGSEQGYLSVEKVRNDKDKARDVLIDEFKRAGSALQRAQRLAMAFNIQDQVENMARNINKLRKDVEESTLNSLV